MHTTRSSLPRLLTAVALILGFAITVQAQGLINTADYVRISVSLGNAADRKDIKGSQTDSVTEKKTLQITLEGKPGDPEKRKGKWTVYGRDLGSNQIKKVATGDFQVALKDGKQQIESKPVSMSYTPKHSVTSVVPGHKAKGKGKPVPAKQVTKDVAAKGVKYLGCSVVITQGGKVVGEFYDPAAIKDTVR